MSEENPLYFTVVQETVGTYNYKSIQIMDTTIASL